MTQYRLATTEAEIPSVLASDPTLNGDGAGTFGNEIGLSADQMNEAFFAPVGADYVPPFFAKRDLGFRVLTHPTATRTCFEKAKLLGDWRALNVIKALYLEDANTGDLYGMVVPETGCFLDREKLAFLLDPSGGIQLRRAQHLPDKMHAGTCSPFLMAEHLASNGGPVRRLLFDNETLVEKKRERLLDDFSLGEDPRISVQLNYYHCYQMLKREYPEVVTSEEILPLSFQETFVRKRGQITVQYKFKTLNYRVATFVEDNHGFGDVSIENDFSDELDLPDSLTRTQ